MYIEYNPNPVGSHVGDCVVRAVSKALNESWENTYIKLCIMGFTMGDMPNGDNVFGAVLRMHGFKKRTLPDTCPDCYTVRHFAEDNPYGTFVLGLGGHVVTVKDGDIYDAFDSSSYIPVYYWYRASEERINYEPDSNSDSSLLRVPAASADVLHERSTDAADATTDASADTGTAKPAEPAPAAKPAK